MTSYRPAPAASRISAWPSDKEALASSFPHREVEDDARLLRRSGTRPIPWWAGKWASASGLRPGNFFTPFLHFFLFYFLLLVSIWIHICFCRISNLGVPL
jgi:hypothetical protein